jgi:hypothetical protein
MNPAITFPRTRQRYRTSAASASIRQLSVLRFAHHSPGGKGSILKCPASWQIRNTTNPPAFGGEMPRTADPNLDAPNKVAANIVPDAEHFALTLKLALHTPSAPIL